MLVEIGIALYKLRRALRQRFAWRSVDAKRVKKILTVPLAAITVATLLAVIPTGSTVPILSTLEAEPADAHPVTEEVTIWQRDRSLVECRWEWQQVIVGYETRQRTNSRFGQTYEVPIYDRTYVRVCEPVGGRYVTRTQHRHHIHVSDQQCQDALVFVAASAVAYLTRGRSGSTQANATGGTVVAAEGSEAVAGNWVTRTICTYVPRIIWLS